MQGDSSEAINVPPLSALLIAASSLDCNQVQSSAIDVPPPSALLIAASSLPNFASLFVSSAFSASESSPDTCRRLSSEIRSCGVAAPW